MTLETNGIESSASGKITLLEELKLSACKAKRTAIISTGILLSFSCLTPAYAADEERLKALESKLSQALSLISSLQKEIDELKQTENDVAGSQVSTTAAAPKVDNNTIQTVEENTERIDVIEDVVLDLEEKTGSRALVQAFDAVSLDIGGFLHSAATHVDGEGGTATSFNRQTFELLVKADLGEKWSAFMAQAFIRESAPMFTDPEGRRTPSFTIPGPGIAPTVIAWANYKSSDALNVRIGRFITPHGIINIDHFPASLLDPEQPQFLRPFGGQTVFANFMTGANVHGQKFLKNGTLKYDAYVGSFVGNPQKFNYGARVAYSFADTGITIGANVGGGSRARTTFTAGIPLNSDYTLYGADLLYDKGKILWKSEIFATDENLGNDRLAFYTQPAYRINDKLTAFYRFDFLDDGRGTGDQIEHAFGINVKPIQNVVVRGIFTMKNFESVQAIPPLPSFTEADVRSYQLSATFSF